MAAPVDQFAAIIQQSNGIVSLSDPASDFIAITPSDTIQFAPTRGVYVGGAGTLVVDGAYGGTSVTLSGLLAGMVYPFRINRAYTASSATGIVGLY